MVRSVADRTFQPWFLAALTERCSSKKAEFEKRNMLRAGEEAAIAEAISILSSDAAFESFGKVG